MQESYADPARRQFIVALLSLLGGTTFSLAPAIGSDASRIVALDSIAVSLSVALNIVPIGATDARNYRYGHSDAVPGHSMTDVGFDGEPNLELLSALRPSLIVSGWSVDNAVLESIAPVLTLKLYSGQPDAYLALEQGLCQLGRRLGIDSRAATVVAGNRNVFALCKERLNSVGTLPPLYLTDLTLGGGKMCVFGSHSVFHSVATRLGLHNAWNQSDEIWGWRYIGIEHLAEDHSAIVVRLRQYGSLGESVEARLMETDLWKCLPAVKAGRVIELASTDFVAGLQTATRFATLLTDALLTYGRA